jgi:hypothetical protein
VADGTLAFRGSRAIATRNGLPYVDPSYVVLEPGGENQSRPTDGGRFVLAAALGERGTGERRTFTALRLIDPTGHALDTREIDVAARELFGDRSET